MKTDLLIVYVKKPVPGNVKTRLIPKIGAEAACLVYDYLLKHTLKVANQFQGDVLFSFDGDCPELSELSISFKTSRQKGRDLGDKMSNDFQTAFESGYTQIVLIGSDIPWLSINLINQSFKELSNNGSVIGPTKDGGYYLIGFHSRLQSQLKVVFNRIDWSTDRVFDQTISQLKNIATHPFVLEKLQDVDRPEDLSIIPQLPEVLQHQPKPESFDE